MSRTLAGNDVRLPESLIEASAMLTDLGDRGEPLAGGTWLMRAPLRGAPARPHHVALKGIPELRGANWPGIVDLGSLLTHTDVAALDCGPAFAGIRDAAHRSAFPHVRNVATVGGNIAAAGFAEADLVPALLAADAELVVFAGDGARPEPLEDYLASRTERPAGELITRIRVPAPAGRASAFERHTVRVTGEYAMVNVGISVDITAGHVRKARVAVGCVEPVARLCPAAGAALLGCDPAVPAAIDAAADEAAEAAAGELEARDAPDCPAWYRTAVLPVLFRRALTRIQHRSI